MEDWALIRRLVADGVPQRQAARDVGIGRSTVERALASDRPPKYERQHGLPARLPRDVIRTVGRIVQIAGSESIRRDGAGVGLDVSEHAAAVPGREGAYEP